MATSSNNLASNFSRPLAKVFLEEAEGSRVLTKAVDTQLLTGKFNPSSGANVDFKRPHDYKTDRTSGGDISAVDKSDIVSGKATGTVQDYFTVHMDWDEVDEALKLDQLSEILKPAATRIITDLETDLAAYMMKNGNLAVGDPDQAVDAWSDIAKAGALMDSMGVPNDNMRFYVMNPYTLTNMADVQRGLSSGSDSLVNTAWQNAQLSTNLGNLRAFSSNALGSYTAGSPTDRAGTVASNPDVTYATAKDTMTQSIAVSGFGAGSDTIKAGEIVEITGRHHVSLATRNTFTDNSGSNVKFRGVVTADVTLSGGAGTIVIAGAGIYEANGQYNTTDSAIVSGDVITLLGTASTVYQPSLFFHKQAFGLGTVKLSKLFSTDTVATTQDGMSIRISRYSDGDANKQKVRFDLLPAYATFNPFYGGQAHGHA